MGIVTAKVMAHLLQQFPNFKENHGTLKLHKQIDLCIYTNPEHTSQDSPRRGPSLISPQPISNSNLWHLDLDPTFLFPR